MNTNAKRILYWSPRILCIVFAIFLSLIALDVFNEGYGIGDTVLALLIHLIPAGIIVIGLVIAWNWEWVGALLFITLVLSYLVMNRGESWIISGPFVLIGILFLLDWKFRAQLEM